MSDGEIYYESFSGMSFNYTSISTSFKASLRTGDSRLITSEERSLIGIPQTHEKFVDEFLLPWEGISNVMDVIKEDDSLKEELQRLTPQQNEADMYTPLTRLFNKIAGIVSQQLNPDDEPMVFHLSSKIPPAGQSRQEDHSLTPDIIVLPPQRDFEKFTHTDTKGELRIPWVVLESVVEVKPKKDWKHQQVMDYMETLLQYRPDKVYSLGLSCNQHSYRFYYADACIQRMSIAFSWDDLSELVRFIYSLHQMYKKHVGRDESYTLKDVKWQGINATPEWHLASGGTTNEVQPMFARKGTGRRTWLGIGQEIVDPETASIASMTPGGTRIVKDMWRDDWRRFVEGRILNAIHKDGFISGVARHVYAGPVNVPAVNNPEKGNRIKERVVMASTGLRLSACESVLDFLKVIYDLVETHQQLVEKRGVLHRDISWYNVLCKPEHFTSNVKVIEHPTIEKILGGCGGDPLCLLTDFDNSSLIQDENDPKKATQRTGTPMFMSCELSDGYDAHAFLSDVDAVTLDQFALGGRVLDAYLTAYSQKAYDDYNAWLASVLSGTIKPFDPFASSKYAALPHRPHHDMESVYWIILWFIIKAWPTETTDLNLGEGRTNRHKALRHQMLSRRVDPESCEIFAFLTHSKKNWGLMLHPAFKKLTGMLADMSQYLCMRWSRFPDSAKIPSGHAHEAFKRLLLKEIIRMTDENDHIPIRGPRPPPLKLISSATQTPTNGSRIPSEAGTSTSSQKMPDASGNSQGSQKRRSSTSASCEPPPKKQRLLRKLIPKEITLEKLQTEGEGTTPEGAMSEESAFLDRFALNLADDAKWFL